MGLQGKSEKEPRKTRKGATGEKLEKEMLGDGRKGDL